jgi:hypothetical protein
MYSHSGAALWFSKEEVKEAEALIPRNMTAALGDKLQISWTLSLQLLGLNY